MEVQAPLTTTNFSVTVLLLDKRKGRLRESEERDGDEEKIKGRNN